ncbi:NmrA family NAD(P)-binding protein [Mycolicibacterium cosmeticum]|uniref:NmrA family NAD(P)-binding protein n=1 Tax=Mycolicibacterium cosmeticum TaxID=258533 RepID=UPI003204700C
MQTPAPMVGARGGKKSCRPASINAPARYGMSDKEDVAMSESRVLITGATGSTGFAAAAALRGSDVQVRAMVHQDDERTEPLRQLGAEIVTGDLLELDSLVSAMDGVDSAYFVYPVRPGLLEAASYFAQAARETAVGAIVNLSQRTAHRHSKSHAAQNHWISEQVFDWSSTPVTHLRPTLFADWLLYPFAQQAITVNDSLVLPFGSGRFAPIASEDQGRVIATVLTDPTAHAGQTYLLNGPEVLDGDGIAAALTEELGRTITYRPIPIADFQEIARVTPQFGEFAAQHMGAVVAELIEGRLSDTNDVVERLTGTPPMSIQAFAGLHRLNFASRKPA